MWLCRALPQLLGVLVVKYFQECLRQRKTLSPMAWPCPEYSTLAGHFKAYRPETLALRRDNDEGLFWLRTLCGIIRSTNIFVGIVRYFNFKQYIKKIHTELCMIY